MNLRLQMPCPAAKGFLQSPLILKQRSKFQCFKLNATTAAPGSLALVLVLVLVLFPSNLHSRSTAPPLYFVRISLVLPFLLYYAAFYTLREIENSLKVVIEFELTWVTS